MKVFRGPVFVGVVDAFPLGFTMLINIGGLLGVCVWVGGVMWLRRSDW